MVDENVLKIFDATSICQDPERTAIYYGDIVGYEYVPIDNELLYCVIPETTPIWGPMNLTRTKPES